MDQYPGKVHSNSQSVLEIIQATIRGTVLTEWRKLATYFLLFHMITFNTTCGRSGHRFRLVVGVTFIIPIGEKTSATRFHEVVFLYMQLRNQQKQAPISVYIMLFSVMQHHSITAQRWSVIPFSYSHWVHRGDFMGDCWEEGTIMCDSMWEVGRDTSYTYIYWLILISDLLLVCRCAYIHVHDIDNRGRFHSLPHT